ncbi:NYN domain-containing protein [Aurantimonas coralicida]|uniref:NYN domain-containing protein n=1 Tax=Aurantimonas coralicida TaxID=182270 RepID=UPI001D19500C|nr:NYN domain-containing protein [Aurantimonas coralicida]MCC4298431.1 NYN domain-containing protein [Aurantimonas coralicida]
MKVACYVDGFNLYHAIADLKKPHLKWVDIWALASSICRDGEELTKVAYFSAYATWLPDPYKRHRQYVAALKNAGVECHMARFSEKTAHCRSCGSSWKQHEEKETDVHFSLALLEDAMDNVFDRAIIISADSDHVPAVRRIRSRFPGKQVFVATPPDRHANARELLKVSNSGMPITAGRLGKCLLPETAADENGQSIFTRPPSYAPPAA